MCEKLTIDIMTWTCTVAYSSL